MQKKEIIDQIKVLEKQNQEYNKIMREMERQVKRNLYWWFLIPLFGFIVFEIFVQKRKETGQWQKDSILVKTELTKNEFAILKLKKQLENLEKNQF